MAAAAPPSTLGVARVIEQLKNGLRHKVDTVIAEIQGEGYSQMQLLPTVTRLCMDTVPKPPTLSESEYDLAVQAITSELFRPEIVTQVIERIRTAEREKSSARRLATKNGAGAVSAALAEDMGKKAPSNEVKGRLQVAPVFPPRIAEFERSLPGEIPPDIDLGLQEEMLMPTQEAGVEEDKNQSQTNVASAPVEVEMGDRQHGTSILEGEDSLLGPPPPPPPPLPTPNQEAMEDYNDNLIREEEEQRKKKDDPSSTSAGCSDAEKKEDSGEEDSEETKDYLLYLYLYLRSAFRATAIYEKDPASKSVLSASWAKISTSIDKAVEDFQREAQPQPPKGRDHEYAKVFLNKENVKTLLGDIADFMPQMFLEGELCQARAETDATGHPHTWLHRVGPDKLWSMLNKLETSIIDYYTDPHADPGDAPRSTCRPPAKYVLPEWIVAAECDEDDDDSDFVPEPSKDDGTADKSNGTDKPKFELVLRGLEPDIDAIRQAAHDGKRRYAANLLKDEAEPKKKKKRDETAPKKKKKDEKGEKKSKKKKTNTPIVGNEENEFEAAREWSAGSAFDADLLLVQITEWRKAGNSTDVPQNCVKLARRTKDLLASSANPNSSQWATLERILLTPAPIKFKRGVPPPRVAGIPTCCSITSAPIEDHTTGITLVAANEKQVGVYLHPSYLTLLLSLHAALNAGALVKAMDPENLARYLIHAHKTVSCALSFPPIGA